MKPELIARSKYIHTYNVLLNEDIITFIYLYMYIDSKYVTRYLLPPNVAPESCRTGPTYQ